MDDCLVCLVSRHLSVKKYREEMDAYVGPNVHEYRKVIQVPTFSLSIHAYI
jgi:hypothetical protein